MITISWSGSEPFDPEFKALGSIYDAPNEQAGIDYIEQMSLRFNNFMASYRVEEENLIIAFVKTNGGDLIEMENKQ